ncbi:MAG TPA: hydroxyethylthiazole kinase [Pseudolabrys sp.]|nr:hydroxyethylthiazole kinase [Pseudolabrys sp.]
MQTLPGDLPAIAADIVERLRQRAPRVHCVTNSVAQNFTANMLLAVGAVPSMTTSPDEIAAFVRGADALLVNLGTFDAERRAAVGAALSVVEPRAWVFDPVFVDRSADRAAFAQSLLVSRPAVVRLNSAELAALSAGDDPRAAAARWGTTVALSGATDVVTDGASSLSLANGHAWMARVTAMGCAGSALVAACLAVEADPVRAAAAALLMLGIAGERAADESRGPGTFATAIIDAIHLLDGATVLRSAKVGA